MRTRIALTTVLPVTCITIMTTWSRPTVAQAAPTTASRSSGWTQQPAVAGSLEQAAVSEQPTLPSQLVAFRARRPADQAITGLGASLSTATELLGAEHIVTGTTTPAPATVTSTTGAPAPAPAVPITDATSTATANWACIRLHESSDRYNDPTAPSGAYGIIPITWHSNGYSGWPYQASAAVQDALALKLYNEFGWQPWSTRFVCGL